MGCRYVSNLSINKLSRSCSSKPVGIASDLHTKQIEQSDLLPRVPKLKKSSDQFRNGVSVDRPNSSYTLSSVSLLKSSSSSRPRLPDALPFVPGASIPRVTSRFSGFTASRPTTVASVSRPGAPSFSSSVPRSSSIVIRPARSFVPSRPSEASTSSFHSPVVSNLRSPIHAAPGTHSAARPLHLSLQSIRGLIGKSVGRGRLFQSTNVNPGQCSNLSSTAESRAPTQAAKATGKSKGPLNTKYAPLC